MQIFMQISSFFFSTVIILMQIAKRMGWKQLGKNILGARMKSSLLSTRLNCKHDESSEGILINI